MGLRKKEIKKEDTISNKSVAISTRTLQVYSTIICVSVFYCSFIHKNIFDIFSIPKTQKEWIFHSLTASLSVGILLITSYLFQVYFLSYRTHKNEVGRIIGPLNLSNVIFISFFGAIAEELFFRGVLQPYLGVVLLSLLVSIFQISPTKGFSMLTLLSFVTSILLGILFARTHSLIPGLIVHFIVNIFLLKDFMAVNSNKET